MNNNNTTTTTTTNDHEYNRMDEVIIYYDSVKEPNSSGSTNVNESILKSYGYDVKRFYNSTDLVQSLIHCTSHHDEGTCRLGSQILIMAQRSEADRTEILRLKDFMRYQFDHNPNLIMTLSDDEAISMKDNSSSFMQVRHLKLTSDDLKYISVVCNQVSQTPRLKQIIKMHPAKFESISNDDNVSKNFKPILDHDPEQHNTTTTNYDDDTNDICNDKSNENLKKQIFDWDFYAHNFDYDQLTWLAREMFVHLLYGRLKEELKELVIPKDEIMSFLLIVRESYHSKNPYHNFRHAIDVLQATFYFLIQLGAIPDESDNFVGAASPIFSGIDSLILLIVAVGHDVGHPGVTNAFLNSINSPLSRIYNDKSVLESFHSASFCQILNRHWPMIIKNAYAKSTIVESIISTDMALHFKYMEQIQSLIGNRDDVEDLSVYRSLLCCIIIKCADISNVSRHLDISAKWGGVLTKEFSEINSHEIDFGLKKPPDKNEKLPDPQLALAKGQVFFINTYARPLFSSMAKIFPQFKFTIDIIEANCKSWENKINSSTL